MAEIPGNSNSEETLQVHDFIKYEIQGVATDGKTPLNYQIVANEGFLYLQEPKLLKDHGNQMKTEKEIENKTPIFFMSDLNSDSKIDNNTQHTEYNRQSCGTNYSLQNVDRYTCLQKESLFFGGSRTKHWKTSAMVLTDETAGIESDQKMKKACTQKVNTDVPTNTTKSVTGVEYGDLDAENRLYQLLKKLMRAKQKEKQQYQWNCYITELRNKHNAMNNEQSSFALPDQNYHYPLAVDKQYSSDDHFILSQSINSEESLKNERYLTNETNFMNLPFEIREENLFRNRGNYLCYPSSSEAQFLIQECKRSKKSTNKRLPKKNLLKNVEIISKYSSYCEKTKSKNPLPNHCYESKRYCKEPSKTISKTKASTCKNAGTDVQRACGCKREKISSTQTNFGAPCECPYGVLKSLNDPNMKETVNTNKISNSRALRDRYLTMNKTYSQFLDETQCNHHSLVPQKNDQTIATIEIKIDHLINSINTLIDETKTSQCTHKKSQRSVAINYSAPNVNIIKDFKSNAERLSSIGEQQTLTTNKPVYMELHEDIFLEELNKSNKAKQDIENIINGCSVKRDTINFDFPTKECSTEVTASLSKQDIHDFTNSSIISQEQNKPGSRSSTAANTEPLGFLALMQVSTETIKQLLSFVPALKNTPRHQQHITQMSHGCMGKHQSYMCSICGATFARSADLSDHIKIHTLVEARNCCVCRHVLDSQNKHLAEFSCQYCGQKFARAYCCELHQQSCATRFGKRHEPNCSLTLLR